MSRTLGVGVIGLRFGGQVHVPAFRRDPRCEVVAIAGRDAVSAAEAARRHNVPSSYGDWRALVAAPDVDLVSIAVPPAVQPRIIVEAARLGKHVFCEKPLAASVDDARAALTAVDAAGVRHAIDFIFPEIASWQQVKTSVSEGAIGPPAHFAYSWRTETYATRTRARSWKNRPDEGGGVLGNFVSHVFYNIEWLLGGIREFDSVACSRDPRAGHAFDAVVRLDGGITGSVSVCTDAYPGSGHIVEIYGEDGALVLRNSTSDYVSGFEARMATRRSGQWSRLATSEQVNPSDDGRVNAVGSLVQRFVDTIHSGGSMAPNLSDGVRVQTLLARAAAAEGLAGSGAQTLP